MRKLGQPGFAQGYTAAYQDLKPSNPKPMLLYATTLSYLTVVAGSRKSKCFNKNTQIRR